MAGNDASLGWLGTARMGAAMAARLIDDGNTVTVSRPAAFMPPPPTTTSPPPTTGVAGPCYATASSVPWRPELQAIPG
ncbi:MAG TPA: hypothetical protein VHZ03_35345 [Trebonia sp.]|jgi:hypothetical protein|nr:hypothetical protein [Trebonia sp.]